MEDNRSCFEGYTTTGNENKIKKIISNCSLFKTVHFEWGHQLLYLVQTHMKGSKQKNNNN